MIRVIKFYLEGWDLIKYNVSLLTNKDEYKIVTVEDGLKEALSVMKEFIQNTDEVVKKLLIPEEFLKDESYRDAYYCDFDGNRIDQNG